MPDHEPALIADRLADGLRRGLVAVTGVLLLVYVPTVLDGAASYRPWGSELVAYAILIVVTVLAAVRVLGGRPWGPWRWPLLGAAFVAHVVATAAMAPAALFGPTHWAWETFGWWAVMLLLDRPLGWLAAALAAYSAVAVVLVVLAGRADVRTFVAVGMIALVLMGLQIAAWLLGAATRRVATAAVRLAAEGERLRTAEHVAEEIHRDRQDRYAQLADTAGPLLASLADGTLDPADPAVRQACLIEAARIRRLFAEADDSGDPLMHELTACADVASRRGVLIQLAVRGQCPPVPQPVRRALTEPALLALTTAVSTARLTVVATPAHVTVSAVTDGQHLPESVAHDAPSVDVSWARHDGTVWMEASWAGAT